VVVRTHRRAVVSVPGKHRDARCRHGGLQDELLAINGGRVRIGLQVLEQLPALITRPDVGVPRADTPSTTRVARRQLRQPAPAVGTAWRKNGPGSSISRHRSRPPSPATSDDPACLLSSKRLPPSSLRQGRKATSGPVRGWHARTRIATAFRSAWRLLASPVSRRRDMRVSGPAWTRTRGLRIMSQANGGDVQSNWLGYPELGRVGSGQICRVGDTVRDKISPASDAR